MSRKENGDEIAAAMAKKRWDKTPAKKRSEHAKMMIQARWERYYAEHPEKRKTARTAASRNKTRKKAKK